MIYEFEGKSECDAIDTAIAELGLQSDEFDVEIIEIQKSSLFKKGYAKIRIYVDDEKVRKPASFDSNNNNTDSFSANEADVCADNTNDTKKQHDVVAFLSGIIEKMGYTAHLEAVSCRDKKLLIKIITDDSAILIGKKGKNIDALQLFANVYAGKINLNARIMVDCENYRIRREESLVRLAYTAADKVVGTKKSILLEPMNPYERRLVHSTLSDIHDVDTKSEGDGLFKQVRVLYKGL